MEMVHAADEERKSENRKVNESAPAFHEKEQKGKGVESPYILLSLSHFNCF